MVDSPLIRRVRLCNTLPRSTTGHNQRGLAGALLGAFAAVVKGGDLVRNVEPVNVGPVGAPGEDLNPVFGDQQGVLKLGAPLSVLGGRRPVVRPELSEGERKSGEGLWRKGGKGSGREWQQGRLMACVSP